MPPILTAFATSPDRGQGLARDMRVRWALEELAVAYDVQLLSFAELKQPAHLARNPFGQIPTWQEGDRTLFESGAIVLHLAEQHPGLLPRDPDARMRAIMWVFAALNTVEPPIVERSMAWVLEREQPWYAQRLPMLDERVQRGRPDDGLGAAAPEEQRPARPVPTGRHLCGPGHATARLPACVCCAAGGFPGRLALRLLPGNKGPAVTQAPCVTSIDAISSSGNPASQREH